MSIDAFVRMQAAMTVAVPPEPGFIVILQLMSRCERGEPGHSVSACLFGSTQPSLPGGAGACRHRPVRVLWRFVLLCLATLVAYHCRLGPQFFGNVMTTREERKSRSPLPLGRHESAGGRKTRTGWVGAKND